MNLYLDIETNLAHSVIWCCAVSEGGAEPRLVEAMELQNLIAQADLVVGHNIMGFDAPVLKRLWGVTIPFRKIADTVLLSRLSYPDRDGGHSLAAWGKRLGMHKGDYSDHDAPVSEEKISYCFQDVRILVAVHQTLLEEIQNYKIAPHAVTLEHEVAFIIEKQVARGVRLDEQAAQVLHEAVEVRMSEIEAYFSHLCPPRLVELWSVKTKKPLKPWHEHFNVGSRQQIVEKMFEWGLGGHLKARTETGRYKVDEETLEGLDTPEAKLLNVYLNLQKRLGLIASWREAAVEGRIHGGVITNGAATGRMTHRSPNCAQVPRVGSPLGKQCRALFVPTEGYKLLGADASGLELRMLAHYMKDADYIKAVVSGSSKEGTDVHTVNQKAAGLPSRDAAKTFIYALLYGAGAGKIGSIVGGGPQEGQRLIDQFMEATPSLRALKSKVDGLAQRGWLPGLDGRCLWVRSPHKALNTLLQGAGAIVMKQALVILYRDLRDAGIEPRFVLNIHDEWQIEVLPEKAEKAGKLATEAIRKAGEVFKLRCPLAGEYKIGNNWSETH